MYDICGHRADGDVLNCANNTHAAPPSGELALMLQATCPTLWSEQGGMNGSYCCTPRQVEVLQNNVRFGLALGRVSRVGDCRSGCSTTPTHQNPSNQPPDQSAQQTQRALPFIIGCPACQHNFVHLWCVLTCSPDQATFTNVTSVQLAADNNATAVQEVDIWVDEGFSGGLFNSCKVREWLL